MMLLKTIYLNRYSNTEEPDDQGRWVRLADDLYCFDCGSKERETFDAKFLELVEDQLLQAACSGCDMCGDLLYAQYDYFTCETTYKSLMNMNEDDWRMLITSLHYCWKYCDLFHDILYTINQSKDGKAFEHLARTVMFLYNKTLTANILNEWK
jgi:hypothetical protein